MICPLFPLTGALVLLTAFPVPAAAREPEPSASTAAVLAPSSTAPSTSSMTVRVASAGTTASQSSPLVATEWLERPEWARHFEVAGVEGTFLLYDPFLDRMSYYGTSPRVGRPFVPASTFKIPNSLIALETGGVRDENEVIAWDGVKRRIADWNRDHTMRTAFPASAVPFYQELARRIGPERMQHYVDRIGYGNRNLGGGIDQFWLTGDLRITPEEQIAFLVRLARNQLPFSPRTMDIVKEIMIREKTDGCVLRGKTGWASDFKPQVGWYVGWVERGDRQCFFVLNIDIREEKDAAARLSITRAILAEEGLLK